MYVKLFASILDSSVWDESPETRLVWITMLVMADENGFVRGTAQSVARRAVVTQDQAVRAIAVLESPDPRSHTTDHEGRRIEPTDGGWLVLNYGKYREMRTRKQVKEAEKKRRQRERAKDGGTSPACPDVSPPYASAPASDVVSSLANEAAKSAYLTFPANPAMDSIVKDEAVARGWSSVSRCLVEMQAAGAKWTPLAFRSFLARIPHAPVVNAAAPGPTKTKRWCDHCEGPEMRESSVGGRLQPMHSEGCPSA